MAVIRGLPLSHVLDVGLVLACKGTGVWRERVGTFSKFFSFKKSSSLLEYFFGGRKKEKLVKTLVDSFLMMKMISIDQLWCLL